MLVSVVVPVYNAGVFLRECLDSILNQSYTELEIVIIENGSTDDSLSICSSYKDTRIKLVSCEKCGAGKARNIGLSMATGKYICFVDADDYIHEDYVLILLENIKNNAAQLSICNFSNITIDSMKEGISVKTPNIVEGNKEADCFLTFPISENDNRYPVSHYETHFIRGKLFNLHSIKEYNIRFNEDIG